MLTTILQTPIDWNSPQTNLARLDNVVSQMEQTDVLVLPEMFTTGFDVRPKQGDVLGLEWMKKAAKMRDMAVAGSLITEEGGKFRNRFYFVKPDGSVAHYDKHHLFTYGGEPESYEPGQERVIVEWRGFRFALFVCYDLRFPTWMRNHEDYDVALVVASWPSSRRAAWDVLLRARAIENQCYVAAVNRIGNDPLCTYDGGSAIINAYGQTIGSCNDGAFSSFTSNLDIEELRAFREKFPVLRDAD